MWIKLDHFDFGFWGDLILYLLMATPVALVLVLALGIGARFTRDWVRWSLVAAASVVVAVELAVWGVIALALAT